MREYGPNKSVKTQILSAYSSRLGIDLPEERKDANDSDNNDNYTEKLVKQRLRRHELYVQAKTSGMEQDDLNILFPEFQKENPEKAQEEKRQKRLFPPNANGTMVELSDIEYAQMLLQWENIKRQNQQMPSDIELYREIGESLKSLGLNSSQRSVKDETQLQLMTTSMNTIAKRLDKIEPAASIIGKLVNSLNDSGKLPQIVDRFLSRFEATRVPGEPVRQYSEQDFEKINDKLSQ